MKTGPFLVKPTGDPTFPWLIEPVSCSTCSGADFKFKFGSALLTILIGAFIFVVAFSWNSVAQEALERCKDPEQILESKLSYAFLITLGAILAVTFLLYYIQGQKC